MKFIYYLNMLSFLSTAEKGHGWPEPDGADEEGGIHGDGVPWGCKTVVLLEDKNVK